MKPQKMRRHARKMRRYGMQPMIVINSDNEFPDLVAVVVTRWLWRYRSEIGPFYLTLTAITTAAILHLTHPAVWPAVLSATTAMTLVVVILGHRIGLSIRSERLYAAVVTFVTGSWETAATALGPTHRPLPALLLVAPVLAIPWWAHRRRRSRVRVERQLSAWPDIAKSIGLTGSRVLSAVVDAWGFTAQMALRRGQTVSDAIGKLPAIEAALHTRRGAIRIEPEQARADYFTMRVLNTDPHAEPIRWRPPEITSITQPIPLGVFEDAAPATVKLLRRNGLIGGVIGSGKSGVLNVILAVLAGCEDVVIWAIDLKGGMELRPWVSVLGRPATTPEQATALFRDALAELNRRTAESGDAGDRLWEPTRERPGLLIVVDEYAELPEEATDLAESLARLGRAVAVNLLAATQRPTQKAMGQGATRSQMDVRISLRVRERRDADLILGQGMFKAGWQPHQLDAPGKFLISAPEHSNPRPARAYLVTDSDVSATARRHAPRRPVLNPPTIGPDQDAGRFGDGAQGRPESVDQSERTQIDMPDELLWRALVAAPDDGISFGALMEITGMRKTTLHRRLKEHLRARRIVQTQHGHYRATDTHRGNRT